MPRQHIKIILILSFILFTVANLWGAATTYTWDGGGAAGVWEDPLNWDLDVGYPDDDSSGTDTAIINLGGVTTAPVASTTLASLTIANTSTVNPGALINLSVTGLVTCSGTLTTSVAGSTLGSLTINAGGLVNPSGTLTVSGLVTCDGTLTADAAGITLNGGITGTGVFNASTGTTTITTGIDVTTFNDNNGILAIAGDTSLFKAYTFHDVSINAGTLNTSGLNTVIEQDIYGVGSLTAGASQITIGRHMTCGAFTANTSTVSSILH